MLDLNTRLNYLHKVPVFKLPDASFLTPSVVADLIKQHLTYQPRYELLRDYYIGKHSIQNRVIEPTKPNNKLIDSYPEYITNVKTGYFLGKPVTYSYDDLIILQELLHVLEYNDEQDNNNEIAKLSSIFGHAFELHWIDEDGMERFKYIPPTEMFMVYKTDIEETPIGAIRYYFTGQGAEQKIFAELYLNDRVIEFYGKLDDELTINRERPHLYGDVPVIEFKNNDERLGDFENVITLIDAYEVVMSDSVNEIQYFNDAYLVLKNLLMTDNSDVQDMKNNRIILLDENGSAEWLVKNINDTHVQNVLDRIQKDIHRLSNTPNLTDEEFSGNLSGVAIKFKLWGLEQDAVNKERKFKKGLQRRLELLSTVLRIKHNVVFDWRDIKINFTRNIPTNILEQSQIVANVNGVVSQKTLLSILPFVDNVNEELEEIAKEEQEQVENFGFTLGNMDSNTTDSQNNN